MLSVCPHDCPSCCSLLVTVDGGRLTSVTGNPDHPFTQGVICGKVREYAERVHSPLRVLAPLRRVGPKGAGEFTPISWDDAIATIAARWRAIVAAEGAEAILPFSYAGSMGQVQYYAGHPLFHALGASRLDRTICVNTAYAGWRATLGEPGGRSEEHTSELQSRGHLVCRLLLEKKKHTTSKSTSLINSSKSASPPMSNS